MRKKQKEEEARKKKMEEEEENSWLAPKIRRKLKKEIEDMF